MSGVRADPGQAAGHERRTLRVFVAFWLIWGALIMGVRVAHPGLELGDGFNDADILHASNWFERNGYRPTLGLPVRETARHPDQQLQVYNTFPPGVFWVHEALRRAGLTELWHFRVVSVAWAMAAVWLWFVTARRLTGSAGVAAAAGIVYMLGRPFVSYSGGLWEHLPMLTLFATLGAWLRFESASTRRAGVLWLVVAAALNFLDNWLTVQHAFMIAFILGVRAVLACGPGALVRDRVVRVLAAGVVGVMPALVMALRVAHQSAYSGGLRQAIEYFRGPIAYRTGETMPDLSRWEVLWWWMLRLGFPGEWRERSLGAASVLYPALAPLALVGAGLLLGLLLVTWRRGDNKPFRLALLNGLLLIAGAATWIVVMKQHAFMHAFPVLMVMPGLALLLGGLIVFAFRARERLANSRAAARWPIVRVASWLTAGAALLMLMPMVRELRRADVFNRVVRLDRGVHAYLRTLSERLSVLHDAGRSLDPQHTLRLSPRLPNLAWALDRPFYQLNRPADARWIADEHVVVDLNERDMPVVAGGLATGMGLPDIVRDPGRVLVFPGRRAMSHPQTRGVCSDAPIAPGVSVREIRWSRTLDDGAFAAAVLVDGPMSAKEASERFLRVRLVDQTGATMFDQVDPLIRQRVRGVGRGLGWHQKRSDPGLVAWIEVPEDLGARAAGVIVELWGGPEAIVQRFDVRADHGAPLEPAGAGAVPLRR